MLRAIDRPFFIEAHREFQEENVRRIKMKERLWGYDAFGSGTERGSF